MAWSIAIGSSSATPCWPVGDSALAPLPGGWVQTLAELRPMLTMGRPELGKGHGPGVRCGALEPGLLYRLGVLTAPRVYVLDMVGDMVKMYHVHIFVYIQWF